MRLVFSLLALFLSLAVSSSWPQSAKALKKAVAPSDRSKAQAWAEEVTDFLTDRRLLELFRPEDVAERFKALIPPSELKIHGPGIGEDSGKAPGGNPEKGIVGLEYELSDRSGDKARISWVTVFMQTKDPDGKEVLSRVVAAMKRKLHRPWRFYSYSGPELFTWEQRQALLLVTVETVESLPEKTGTPGPGPWVTIRIGHVEGFGEP